MKQKIQASITGTAGSADAAAADLKSTAADFGLTPDWSTLELDSAEYVGSYSIQRPCVRVRATCYAEVEVPE